MTSTVPAEFGPALRTAIERSGLSLNEISRRLRARETPVSISALSYWQNGENRPERASSLAAVTALETILGQRPETLTGLLGPRRPRGRSNHRMVAYDQVWRRPETIARALAKVDATPEELDTPHRLSQYVSFRVDESGHEESMRVRRLVRADHDGTSRFLFVIRCSSLTREPVVLFTEGCSPARFRADVPSSTCAFEFALDRTLAAGELAVVEFGVRFPPGQNGEHAQMAIYRPARDMVLQISFDPACLPRHCTAFFQPRTASPPEERGEASFDRETGTFQFITLDPLPGQYGIRWSWT
ncbi:helix-turn-helix transcriptional regulator [Amycolatopsis sp. BJA-103]|uniref:helix-turn-helix transcriptional regulator n=1 Tax=unclassified Amycolatopsis TaxID=2618356 RepID=UPI000C787DCE|nr:helix-turn-helix transcriptional regulator [Amycolatopsis sp. BJA-103]AUI59349.1 transcriptional regulator [Amycolatopsis sp. BJA-103]PNE17209.1 transcriptional regulator [Amycolatopsis sp. BJA-103]